MVATFILTRTFAISALFVGAVNLARAAPIVVSPNAGMVEQWCYVHASVSAESSSGSLPLLNVMDPPIDIASLIMKCPEQMRLLFSVGHLVILLVATGIKSTQDVENVDDTSISARLMSQASSKRRSILDEVMAGIFRRTPADLSTDSCREEGCMKKRIPDTDSCREEGCMKRRAPGADNCRGEGSASRPFHHSAALLYPLLPTSFIRAFNLIIRVTIILFGVTICTRRSFLVRVYISAEGGKSMPPQESVACPSNPKVILVFPAGENSYLIIHW
ncbi:uncharacterized protein FIBRA_04064 [Fibroporia radiculosa]|uniref:Uncharacterized protein n=1 Tax=Fibroporia radiculosa TaxID=599839 RepID=J4GNW6_9APHY|nr:uncharacterized protein FIBRA_04064 [Fibroporia radiculosa]CCM01990.1 predicted protein [Fibroporia radiculosa]